jgi:hypothetical protein
MSAPGQASPHGMFRLTGANAEHSCPPVRGVARGVRR